MTSSNPTMYVFSPTNSTSGNLSGNLLNTYTTTKISVPSSDSTMSSVSTSSSPMNVLEGDWSLCYEDPSGFRTCSALRKGAVVHCRDANLQKIALGSDGKYRTFCSDGTEQDVIAPPGGINFAMIGYEPPMIKKPQQ